MFGGGGGWEVNYLHGLGGKLFGLSLALSPESSGVSFDTALRYGTTTTNFIRQKQLFSRLLLLCRSAAPYQSKADGK